MALIKELPFTIVATKLSYDAEKWCQENLGERYFAIGRKTGNWTVFWNGVKDRYRYTWYFRNESDAMWFMLRWL